MKTQRKTRVRTRANSPPENSPPYVLNLIEVGFLSLGLKTRMQLELIRWAIFIVFRQNLVLYYQHVHACC